MNLSDISYLDQVEDKEDESLESVWEEEARDARLSKQFIPTMPKTAPSEEGKRELVRRILDGDQKAKTEFIGEYYYWIAKATRRKVGDLEDALTLAVDVLEACVGRDAETSLLSKWSADEYTLASYLRLVGTRYAQNYLRTHDKRFIVYDSTMKRSDLIFEQQVLDQLDGSATPLSVDSLMDIREAQGWRTDAHGTRPDEVYEQKELHVEKRYLGRERLAPQQRRVPDALLDGSTKSQIMESESLTDNAFRQVVYDIKKKIAGLRANEGV